MLSSALRAAPLVLVLALTACPSSVDRGGAPMPSGAEPAAVEPASGETAFAVSGPHGLSATLRYQEQSGEWVLDGHFTVPTGGYNASLARVDIVRSAPEQVRVVLALELPPPDALVTQVVTDLPVHARIEASAEARFEVFVTDRGESQTES